MVANERETWHELYRALPAVPLAQDGSEMPDDEMPVAMHVCVIEERGDRLVIQSRGSTPAQQWRYLVARSDFEHATTPPEGVPREGQAPSAPARTAGSPD